MRDKILVISHVLPFPGASGQQIRVRYMIEAAVQEYEVDFLTYAPSAECQNTEKQLAALGCHPVVLKSCLRLGSLDRLAHFVASRLFVLLTGLKSSNYTVGELELSPTRIRAAIVPQDYRAALYEYFHAVDSVPIFQSAGVPTILDMHNVLWKSREQRLSERSAWPRWVQRFALSRYRRQEERSWDQFNALVAINRREYDLVGARQPLAQKLFYAPMGTDLSSWPACWQPTQPPRLAYYGSLASPHNEAAALRCYECIMPVIWQRFPKAELWLVGSTPRDRLRHLANDPRVKVTGFVEKVQDVLRTMSLVLCPWSGTYGFRSRVVEVMALGVPVVATPDAVDGMELESGRGIILAGSDNALAERALELLSSPDQLAAQSSLARLAVECLYSLETTYGRLMNELKQWLDQQRNDASGPVVRSPVVM